MSHFIETIFASGLIDAVSSMGLLADAEAPSTIRWFIDFVLHLDDKLKELVRLYGAWTHLILFAVIFCETGLVFTPFLPGDSLLFAAGAFAADKSLHIEWLVPLLIVAAILGDTVNYWMGCWIGKHAFSGRIPFLKKEHLDETHEFFEKYGPKTIILARFVPIVRTFAPFVAGIGSMNYKQFLAYNIVGGVVWVLSFLYLGFWVGGFEIVQKNFELVTIGIVLISVMPIAWKWWSGRGKSKSAPSTGPSVATETASVAKGDVAMTGQEP